MVGGGSENSFQKDADNDRKGTYHMLQNVP
jgi:hypothetical protein